MTGMPAQNDSFSIARSRTEDMFTTLSNLATALESSTLTTGRARAASTRTWRRYCSSSTRRAITCSSVRAEVGARLSAIDDAQEALADRKVELETTTSQLRDLDYAEAVSRMNQQLVGPAGRAGVVFEDLAAVAVRLPALMPCGSGFPRASNLPLIPSFRCFRRDSAHKSRTIQVAASQVPLRRTDTALAQVDGHRNQPG